MPTDSDSTTSSSIPRITITPHAPPQPAFDPSRRESATVLMSEREMRRVADAFQSALVAAREIQQRANRVSEERGCEMLAPPPAYTMDDARDHSLAPATLQTSRRGPPYSEKVKTRGWSREWLTNVLLILLGVVFLGITVLFAILAASNPGSALASPAGNDPMLILLEILPFVAAGVLITLISIIWRRDMRRRMREARIEQWRGEVQRANARLGTPWQRQGRGRFRQHSGRELDEETLLDEPRVRVVLPVVGTPPVAPPSFTEPRSSGSLTAEAPVGEKSSAMRDAMVAMGDSAAPSTPPPPPAYDASVGSWMNKTWLPSSGDGNLTMSVLAPESYHDVTESVGKGLIRGGTMVERQRRGGISGPSGALSDVEM